MEGVGGVGGVIDLAHTLVGLLELRLVGKVGHFEEVVCWVLFYKGALGGISMLGNESEVYELKPCGRCRTIELEVEERKFSRGGGSSYIQSRKRDEVEGPESDERVRATTTGKKSIARIPRPSGRTDWEERRRMKHQ